MNDEESLMDQNDLEEGLMELDPTKSNRVLSAVEKAKKQKKEFHKLVSPFFAPRNLGCYCTKDHYVLKLIKAVHMYMVSKARSYHYGVQIYYLKHIIKRRGQAKKKSKSDF